MSATIRPSIKAKPEMLKFLVDRTLPVPQICFIDITNGLPHRKKRSEPRKYTLGNFFGAFPSPLPVQAPERRRREPWAAAGLPMPRRQFR
ncbi:hypothetical protein [Thiobacillus sp.]|uniref:hypothetical protein n=1 Tax=Thiobacillus sp. TaxID=924 RepID=UPI0025F16BA1|nr:hypothetical protein [Thiobacillus sp.]